MNMNVDFLFLFFKPILNKLEAVFAIVSCRKVVDFFLSFPTPLRSPNFDNRAKSYGHFTEAGCIKVLENGLCLIYEPDPVKIQN